MIPILQHHLIKSGSIDQSKFNCSESDEKCFQLSFFSNVFTIQYGHNVQVTANFHTILNYQ